MPTQLRLENELLKVMLNLFMERRSRALSATEQALFQRLKAYCIIDSEEKHARKTRIMAKKVILITGTPCTGKTAIAKQITTKLKANYVNLTDLAIAEDLTSGEDKKRNTIIIDEKRMKTRIRQIIKTSSNNIVIDGHYAAHVVRNKVATNVFILRRNPTELKKLMQQKHYTDTKLWENLAAEILDVSLIDALNAYSSEKICELDITGKTLNQNVTTILNVLSGKEKCHTGIVDWIGRLETEGTLQDYLKI